MNYAIQTTEDFDRQIKRLTKKYHSMPDDLEMLKAKILQNPRLGSDLGDGTRKIRMAIASKGKGKSGGARVIACDVLVSICETDIYLLTIYDKGETDSISRREIIQLKEEIGLL